MNRFLLCITAICIALIVLPINIVSFISLYGSCDENLTKFTSKLYPLVYSIGLINLAYMVILFCFLIGVACNKNGVVPYIVTIIILILNVLFGFVWFVSGILFLLDSISECLFNGIMNIVYGIILWCLAVIIFCLS